MNSKTESDKELYIKWRNTHKILSWFLILCVVHFFRSLLNDIVDGGDIHEYMHSIWMATAFSLGESIRLKLGESKGSQSCKTPLEHTRYQEGKIKGEIKGTGN